MQGQSGAKMLERSQLPVLRFRPNLPQCREAAWSRAYNGDCTSFVGVAFARGIEHRILADAGAPAVKA